MGTTLRRTAGLVAGLTLAATAAGALQAGAVHAQVQPVPLQQAAPAITTQDMAVQPAQPASVSATILVQDMAPVFVVAPTPLDAAQPLTVSPAFTDVQAEASFPAAVPAVSAQFASCFMTRMGTIACI